MEEATGPTAFDWLTFGIALAGFVLAIAALIWNVVEWWLSGHRIKVESGVAITSLRPNTTETLVTVAARNVGRQAVTIDSWSFLLPDDQVMQWASWKEWQGPTTPYRLENGTSVVWHVPASAARDVLVKYGQEPTALIRARVHLGTGKSVVADNAVPVPSAPDDRIANR